MSQGIRWTDFDRKIFAEIAKANPSCELKPWLSFFLSSDEQGLLSSAINHWKKKTIRPLAKETDPKVKRDAIEWIQLYWKSNKTTKWKQQLQDLGFGSTTLSEDRKDRIFRLLSNFRWNGNTDRLLRHSENHRKRDRLRSILFDHSGQKEEGDWISRYLDDESQTLIDLWHRESSQDTGPDFRGSAREWFERRTGIRGYKKEEQTIDDPIRYFDPSCEPIFKRRDRSCLILQDKGKKKHFWILRDVEFRTLCTEEKEEELDREIKLEYDLYEKQKYDEFCQSMIDRFKKTFSDGAMLCAWIDPFDLQPQCIDSFSRKIPISGPCVLDVLEEQVRSDVVRKVYSRTCRWMFGARWEPSWIPLAEFFSQDQFAKAPSAQCYMESKKDWIHVQFQIAWFLLECDAIGLQCHSMGPYQIFLERWAKPIPKSYRVGSQTYSFQENYGAKIHPGTPLYSDFGNHRIPNAWKNNEETEDWKDLFERWMRRDSLFPSESMLYRSRRMTLLWIRCLIQITDLFPSFPCVVERTKESNTFFRLCGMYGADSKASCIDKISNLLSCSDLERIECVDSESKGFGCIDIEWVPLLEECLSSCFAQSASQKEDDSILHSLFGRE